ncbi:MAG: TolC family protein, partial [Thiohalorhabdaceae bacterium]
FDLPDTLPELPEPPGRRALVNGLADHPRLRTVAAQIDQRGTAVALAEKDYYPDMGVDLAYGYRPGSAPNGELWADFASVKFRMSLPLFTAKRQDKRLAAALDEKDALQRKLRRTRLGLERQARTQWAALKAARERADLYDDSILPESEQTVEASVAAYTTGRLDFLNLVRARIQDLEHQLTQWRLRVDEEQAKAELLYLAAGKDQPNTESRP